MRIPLLSSPLGVNFLLPLFRPALLKHRLNFLLLPARMNSMAWSQTALKIIAVWMGFLSLCRPLLTHLHDQTLIRKGIQHEIFSTSGFPIMSGRTSLRSVFTLFHLFFSVVNIYVFQQPLLPLPFIGRAPPIGPRPHPRASCYASAANISVF
ncbi:hypothetical protein DL96DRAFT_1088533 [Flagelloscypha sp. PMI_526]|nr:hypothetical protein DL96DRAFT_1088533 [Flagelloscypha sp. PMI_526]